MRIIYTADLHGNEVQYQKLVDFAIESNADAVIIGGDIAPKNQDMDQFIQGQRVWLKEKLPELLLPLKGKADVYLMMGNDDCAVNRDLLDGQFFHDIHGRRLPLTDDFEIVGYACVPITPFGIKDIEKHDFSDVPEEYAHAYDERKTSNYRLHGFKTSSRGWEPFTFTDEKDSIQRDLEGELYCKSPKKTLYIMHSPPDGTALDQIPSGHVGSMAIRLFIEEAQPYLTLHGHIHETVDISGSFTDTIGATVSASPGNYCHHDELAVLVFDLEDLAGIERLIL